VRADITIPFTPLPALAPVVLPVVSHVGSSDSPIAPPAHLDIAPGATAYPSPALPTVRDSATIFSSKRSCPPDMSALKLMEASAIRNGAKISYGGVHATDKTVAYRDFDWPDKSWIQVGCTAGPDSTLIEPIRGWTVVDKKTTIVFATS